MRPRQTALAHSVRVRSPGLLHRSAGLGAVTALLLATPAQLFAQVGSFGGAGGAGGGNNVPYGSPLDPFAQQQLSASQAQAQSQAANAAANQGSARIEPVEVTSSSADRARNQVTSDDDEDQLNSNDRTALRTRRANRPLDVTERDRIRPPAPPSEFERYVERAVGRPLPRFGAELLVPGSRDFAVAPTATVPPSYILNPGDRIFIGLTGSVEGSVDATIDNDGRIFLPKVGAVRVAGIPYGELHDAIERAASRQYRDFRVAVSLPRLRGIRVYVTGFANNPGAYTVNSLSTLVNAVLAAGGPSAGGSFRSIKLYRNGAQVTDFDLYELIRNGDKSKDAVLQNEDVLFIPPVGRQIAMTGSVNSEAIYEARPGDTLASLLGYAGGPTALADSSRVVLYRLANLDTVGGTVLERSQLASTAVEGGDLVQVLSTGSLVRSLERQSVVVRIEGEVNRPGNYYVPPNANLAEVLTMAGGLTSRAFVYGTNLQRLSVRQQQRQSFAEALQQIEISLAATPLTRDATLDAGQQAAQLASARAVVDRLRQAEPDGRIVLNLPPSANALPGALTLENSDRIFVPPRPTTVGVFGAVYRPASFLIDGTGPKRVRNYLQMAGGPLRVADKGQIFVVHSNGEVVSKRNGGLDRPILPGDVIFVPVKTSGSTVLQRILQISTLAFQFGITAAAIAAINN